MCDTSSVCGWLRFFTYVEKLFFKKARRTFFASEVPPVNSDTTPTSVLIFIEPSSASRSERSSPFTRGLVVFFSVVFGRSTRKRWRCSVIFGRIVRAADSFLSNATSTGTTTSLSTWMTGHGALAATVSRHSRWLRR